MWGFGIFLMGLADYLHGRRNVTCDICGKKFAKAEDLKVHRRELHSDAMTG